MSPAIKYTLDSDSLIGPYRTFYSFDRAPGFWSGLETAIENGEIILVDRVYKELTKPDDSLSTWLKQTNQSKMVDSRNSSILEKLGEILAFVQSSDSYSDKALREWSDADVADPWIIASASVHGFVVVTFETPNVGLNPHHPSANPKIPDVCQHFSVEVTDLYTMMDDLGIRP